MKTTGESVFLDIVKCKVETFSDIVKFSIESNVGGSGLLRLHELQQETYHVHI